MKEGGCGSGMKEDGCGSGMKADGYGSGMKEDGCGNVMKKGNEGGWVWQWDEGGWLWQWNEGGWVWQNACGNTDRYIWCYKARDKPFVISIIIFLKVVSASFQPRSALRKLEWHALQGTFLAQESRSESRHYLQEL